ncbi:hypothetical protein L9F63_015366 [Diploptera punctata]|uniref:Uncharacterized protein n=1 Tax=Diploptera punctata TaxID=6984 RepID=A0AAD8A6N3_DIPPU|nr:hypothetical protein L9F63_015366 [Diploptera punctata]
MFSDDEDTVNNLEMKFKKLMRKGSWTQFTKCIVLVPTMSSSNSSDIIMDIYRAIWFVVNIIIIVFGIDNNSTYRTDLRSEYSLQPQIMVESYTWFPFTEKNCKFAKEMTLIDNRTQEDDIDLSEVDFFPAKIPNDFYGCQMIIAPIGMPPFHITSNYTDENGEVVYVDTGLPSKLLELFAYDFNITLVTAPPISGLVFEEGLELFMKCEQGIFDFAVGSIVYTTFTTQFFDTTIAFQYEYIKILVPCPKQIPREERVVSIFTLTVWFLIIFVFILAGGVLSILSNGYKERKDCGYGTLPQCLQNSWAILIGVGVSEIPQFAKTRLFFVIYVIFSLAISTVFQAFFTTFLIEPGYEKGYKTIEDAKAVNVSVGLPSFFVYIFEYSGVTYHQQFNLVDCTDLPACVSRTMTKGDIVTPIGLHMVRYIAIRNGVQDLKKYVCLLDENQFHWTNFDRAKKRKLSFVQIERVY